jgi:hypothetical protein
VAGYTPQYLGRVFRPSEQFQGCRNTVQAFVGAHPQGVNNFKALQDVIGRGILLQASVGADMTLKSFSFFALLVSGFGIYSLPVSAQSKIQDVPVNFPPASYSGSQFVDNRGCVYVRAGFDGAVTWVPRVSRQREHLCGQKPTFGGQVAAAPASPVPTTTKPVQITATPPAGQTVAPARTTTAVPVVKKVKAPVRKVVRVPASKPAAAELPRVVRRVPAPAATATKPPVVVAPAGQATCVQGNAYRIVNGMKLRVSCGPQSAPHVTTVRRGEAPAPGKNVYYNKNSWEGSSLTLPPETRIVPDHVYKNRDTQVAHVPAGYRPAWEDDRLNPYRAYQTVGGYADTQQVWTNTVPRKLVAQARRHEVKTPIIVGTAPAPLPLTPYVATKGKALVASTGPAAKVGRWIEIGAFTTSDLAKSAVSRLQAAGLTVRMGQHQKNGQTLAVVRVGPYASYDSLQMALTRVQGTGYTQAYIR